jgi:hypothetical protein
LDSLSITSSSANSSFVGENAKFEFIIKNLENDMKVGSKVQFKFPEKIYTKLSSINSKDC